MRELDNQSYLIELSQQFPECEFFIKDELIGFKVNLPQMEATIYLQGATVAELRDQQGQLLWLSPESFFKNGKAIRGGVPVCWPWFGQLDKNPDSIQSQTKGTESPQHGFARILEWQLHSIFRDDEHCKVELKLVSNPETRKYWPFEFELTARFILADEFTMELVTTNTDKRPFEITQALHTYLPIDDISSTSIKGFEGSQYIDALQDWSLNSQTSEIRFNENVDRIYLVGHPATIETNHGKLHLFPQQSHSTVIWNPWEQKSMDMADFPDDGFLRMLCVETANVLEDKRVIKPSQSCSIGFRLFRG